MYDTAFVSSLTAAQDIPRTADGRPDFNGIWQAINTANWDVEPHAASFGPLVAAGAIGAIPAGLGIVEGNEIPYTPEARAQQQENKSDWLANDPLVKCYVPGFSGELSAFSISDCAVDGSHHLCLRVRQCESYCLRRSADFEAPILSWMGTIWRVMRAIRS